MRGPYREGPVIQCGRACTPAETRRAPPGPRQSHGAPSRSRQLPEKRPSKAALRLRAQRPRRAATHAVPPPRHGGRSASPCAVRRYSHIQKGVHRMACTRGGQQLWQPPWRHHRVPSRTAAMASQPFRPSDAPPQGYGSQPPLQFVSSSFTVQEQLGGQPYGGGGYGAGPSTSAYAPVPSAYGGQSFGGSAMPVGRQPVGTLFAASASFEDEPPLLEGAPACVVVLPVCTSDACGQSWASTCRTSCARRAPCCARSGRTRRCATTAT